MSSPYPPLIVMGVSGSGKSTIGRALADALDLEFVDGDDLHPRANKEKMVTAIPRFARSAATIALFPPDALMAQS